MANYDTPYHAVSTDPGAASNMGAVPAGGGVTGQVNVIRVAVSATAGASGDVTVAMPQKARVLDSYLIVTTGVGSSTVQLFDQAAGAGNALSSAMSTASGALVRNASTAATVAVTTGNIFLRWSAGASRPAFEAVIFVQPEV